MQKIGEFAPSLARVIWISWQFPGICFHGFLYGSIAIEIGLDPPEILLWVIEGVKQFVYASKIEGFALNRSSFETGSLQSTPIPLFDFGYILSLWLSEKESHGPGHLS